MKPLVIVSLMASALFAAASAAPAELCTSGGPLSGDTTYDHSATANIWSTGMFTVSGFTASLDISGGSSTGPVTIALGPSDPFALTIRNGFTSGGSVTLDGTLSAGSSITITDVKIGVPAGAPTTVNLDLSFVTLAGATLTITGTTFESDQTCVQFVPCNAIILPAANLATVTMIGNSFTHGGPSPFTFIKKENSNYFGAST